ncbi:MAG: polymer-forming cytoskeletal protein [Ruminococcaceae bacterium]|nr:polymer-forming cytoskeletal protein [Oscillospiraceae bacterium]
MKKFKYVSVDVLIGAETVLTGNLVSESAIKIDGTVRGDIQTSREVILSETADVAGNISAGSLIVAGKLLGDVKVQEQLLIKATGYLEGNIETGSLVIEPGGSFFGMNRSSKPEPEAFSLQTEE